LVHSFFFFFSFFVVRGHAAASFAGQAVRPVSSSLNFRARPD
jgi:hypothetical protein